MSREVVVNKDGEEEYLYILSKRPDPLGPDVFYSPLRGAWVRVGPKKKVNARNNSTP